MGTDYGRRVGFGVFASPEADSLRDLWALLPVAEHGGLEFVGVQDHPYQRRHLDTWSLMATALARTERLRFFPDVANLPLRSPAIIAKSAASLDVLSGGRFELGLGAGAFWEAVVAMGGERRGPREAADALVEAVEVIRLLWSDQRSVRFEGGHYRLAGVRPGPAPAHDIGIWLGVYGPRLLRALGRIADGWVPSSGYAEPAGLHDMHARIDAGAAEAGRDPASIRRVYNVMGAITDGASTGFLRGPAEQWVEQLTELVLEYGMDTFVFGPAENPVRQVERFAAEVVPAVREAVHRERG
ncbi:alkanesulfonate monooxygenase SsuD/methylene tetrahydromethanopterin reductase-like flavin-dependent oxidoreductase (luciferase family) [Nocardiopsis arvandica]|uniref:Alkanesulfonate monooxygenase SsuD/methylene tetrahydromethanopterin reductase-like flavin-dependent oxidoreductase (Luciferase family) n=1 Tax=Nocardiopsis sinuspersici TaxID=501010 RepID=A0A7Y9X7J1_9ACTN|nr:LLM class flavin-dependent oxidoreductase [Nocardiopsis sinuspersici]NYH50646.1 alkanesulfonate monooxygenase SsuD/methylene tetrahydromethanopterin reductase-like flavin-dependent oxidoreductase (luciferase family) [Nocardiopsis sinuspersici]